MHAHPPFITFTITSKVAVYAPAERADTLTCKNMYCVAMTMCLQTFALKRCVPDRCVPARGGIQDGFIVGKTTEYIFLLEMKQGYCICPLSWSVHCNFSGDGKCSERRVGVHPPPSPARANFTLMMECMPDSDSCNSVYSVDKTNS